MGASQDPYYVVQDEASQTLRGIQTAIKSWRASPPGPARDALASSILEDCDSLLAVIDEIERSIKAAEANPARFRLDASEIEARKRWTGAVRRETGEAVREAGGKGAGRGSGGAGGGAGGADGVGAGGAGSYDPVSDALHASNDRFLDLESQRQAQLALEQDQHLDLLGEQVLRIGHLGREMGHELRSQSVLLDELDADMDGTRTRLAAAQKKVQSVLDKMGARGQWFVILLLIGLLILLILMVMG